MESDKVVLEAALEYSNTSMPGISRKNLAKNLFIITPMVLALSITMLLQESTR